MNIEPIPPETKPNSESGFGLLKEYFSKWAMDLVDSGEERGLLVRELMNFNVGEKMQRLKDGLEAVDDPYLKLGEVIKNVGISGAQIGCILSIYALSGGPVETVSQLMSHWLVVDNGLEQLVRIGVVLQSTDMLRNIGAAILNGESVSLQEMVTGKQRGGVNPNPIQYTLFMVKNKLNPAVIEET